MTAIHNSWLVSPYSAKTRSFLRYKGVEFTDNVPTARQLYGPIQRAVGRMVMPTVQLADGSWLQDSSDILDHFEATHPEPSTVPEDPTLAVASALIELFADEWLPMAALHYRWSIPENARFAVREFARCGLPWVPGPIGRRLIRPMSRRMAGYLPVLGVDDQTIPGVEASTHTVIAAAQATLSDRPYLFGGRPCVADFSLYGPLWAHLYRDPGTTHLFDQAPAVIDWMRRLTDGARAEGELESEVPAALDPLFACVFEDQLAWVATLVEHIDQWCTAHPDASRVPRALGTAPFQIRGTHGTRKLITFVQWKAQRARDAYERADGAADPWIGRFHPTPAKAIPPVANRFERREFKEVLAR